MRIVSGEHRGIRLTSVPGKNTRPTSDKVKESIFNIIGPYFSGGHCLDLFAGGGNLGLEAISRGVDSAVFVEKNALAIKTINENIKKLRVENKARVYRNDAFKSLKQLTEQNFIFKIIFMDPPYHFKSIHKYLDEISRCVDSDLFVEKNALAIKTINENIKKLRVENKARVYRNDAFKSLKQLTELNFIFKIIFMDPPYHFKAIHKYLDEIIHNNLLEEEGLIIYEHDSTVKAPSHESLLKTREAHYGTTSITIYKKS